MQPGLLPLAINENVCQQQHHHVVGHCLTELCILLYSWWPQQVTAVHHSHGLQCCIMAYSIMSRQDWNIAHLSTLISRTIYSCQHKVATRHCCLAAVCTCISTLLIMTTDLECRPAYQSINYIFCPWDSYSANCNGCMCAQNVSQKI